MTKNFDSMNEYERMIAALEIFNKYVTAETRGTYIGAEHDEMYAGDTEVVSDEDKKILEELGWHDYDTGSFQKFV